MGTWSISPSSLASIDNNGLVFFREHSSDTSYRITYQDDECGTLTKDVTVFACETPPSPGTCAGSTSSLGSCVSNTATSNAVQIGTWSKNQYCSGSWSFDSSRSVSGTNFINTSSIEFRSDGKIYGKISSSNPSQSQRQCQIPTKLGSEKTDYFTVTQCGQGGGTCSCSTLQLSNTTFHFQNTGTFDGITYTPSTCSVSFSNYPSWVNSITASNGVITASAQQNTSTNMRSGYVDCYVGSERCGQLPVVQDKSPGSQCYTCDDVGIYGISTNQQDASGKTSSVLATFKTACDSVANMSVAMINGDMSISNLSLKNVYVNNWVVSGDVAANSSSSQKAANIAIFMASSAYPCSPTPFNVYQNALTPEPFTMQVIIFNNKSTSIYVDQIRFLVGSTTVIGRVGRSYEITGGGNRTVTVTLDASHNGKTFTSFNVMDTNVVHTEYPTNNTGGTLRPNIMISGVVS